MDGRQPRIIAVTANSTQADRLACDLAGMEGYLGKPVRPADLVRELARAATGATAPPQDDTPVAGGDGVSSEPAVDGAAIDSAALGRLVELTGDRDFVRSLVADFPAEARALVATVAASTPESLPDARRAAHTLKSAATNLGATALSALAARAEKAASAGDAQAVLQLVSPLEAELDRAVAQLGVLDELG
jgi:HPt (histidine-containing phosphotransfer) domain-containing protein